MLDKFWESLGTDLAKRWLEYILGPAFLFWAGGFGFYVWKTGLQRVLKDVQALTAFQQGSWIVLALLVLIFSSLLTQAIRFSILRLLEGYWPRLFNKLKLRMIASEQRSFEKKLEELRRLKVAEAAGNLDDSQKETLTELETWVHWHPAKSSDFLPTDLGNILRARERSPQRKYHLDAVICWPRLWLLLPEHVRSDLSNARSTLDRFVELWFWGLLFLVWAVWFRTPWAAVISLLWLTVAYRMARQAALTYGDLLEAAFDLYRLSLYDALGWSQPMNNEEEETFGKQMTEFLWRGTSPEQITYQSREK